MLSYREGGVQSDAGVLLKQLLTLIRTEIKPLIVVLFQLALLFSSILSSCSSFKYGVYELNLAERSVSPHEDVRG